MLDPALVNRCVMCRARFAAPDIREIDGDHTLLDYHCPVCGYGYARWPKAGLTSKDFGDDSRDESPE